MRETFEYFNPRKQLRARNRIEVLVLLYSYRGRSAVGDGRLLAHTFRRNRPSFFSGGSVRAFKGGAVHLRCVFVEVSCNDGWYCTDMRYTPTDLETLRRHIRV